jgi:hypothetical protein
MTAKNWIPAFAGMTKRGVNETTSAKSKMYSTFRRNDDPQAITHTHKPRRHPSTSQNKRPHNSRNAVVTGKRAARSAGNSPPMNPIASAHLSPLPTSAGETLNANTTWLKFAPSVDTV